MNPRLPTAVRFYNKVRETTVEGMIIRLTDRGNTVAPYAVSLQIVDPNTMKATLANPEPISYCYEVVDTFNEGEELASFIVAEMGNFGKRPAKHRDLIAYWDGVVNTAWMNWRAWQKEGN